MFDNNKMAWFIVVALFGLSVAVLGAHDLRKRMARNNAKAKPDAKVIIEQLKQSDVDPVRAMMKKSDEGQSPKTHSDATAESESSSVMQTLGVDKVMELFESSSEEPGQ